MKLSRFFLLLGLFGTSLTACHKQTPPPEAHMDAEAKQKAIEVREAADKEAAALKEAAAKKETELKEAIIQKAAKAPVPPN